MKKFLIAAMVLVCLGVADAEACGRRAARKAAKHCCPQPACPCAVAPVAAILPVTSVSLPQPMPNAGKKIVIEGPEVIK